MKVFIGSVLVVIIICFGLWLLLSPTFKKVGKAAQKYSQFLEEDDENGNRKQHDETAKK